MSYFEIGIYNTKTESNVGTLWRSAYQLGAAGIFTIGKRYKKQASDTPNVMNNIPLRHFLTIEEFKAQRPIGTVLVGIEMGGRPLSFFTHPKQAIYLLGAEDYGLPKEILEYCNCVVSLESVVLASYNVAVAGSIVMYDRVFNKLKGNL
jgi:tRNA G18 (ribose-2'-O)-methylase SpoU